MPDGVTWDPRRQMQSACAALTVSHCYALSSQAGRCAADAHRKAAGMDRMLQEPTGRNKKTAGNEALGGLDRDQRAAGRGARPGGGLQVPAALCVVRQHEVLEPDLFRF